MDGSERFFIDSYLNHSVHDVKDKKDPDANEEAQNQMTKGGKIEISLQLLTEFEAKLDHQGQGREDPNTDPKLTYPLGRLHLGMNPCDWFNQLVGPNDRRKCKMYCCYFFFICLCSAIIPVVIGNIATRVTNFMFWPF